VQIILTPLFKTLLVLAFGQLLG